MLASYKKVKHQARTYKQKMLIINKVKNDGESISNVMKQFNIKQSTISAIIKSSETIESKTKENPMLLKKKRIKPPKHQRLEQAVILWTRQMRTGKVPLTGNIIKEKALQFAESMGINEFKASNGWIDNFRKRNDISWRVIAGDSDSVDHEFTDDWINSELLPILADYAQKDVFNLDEFGLFWKATPNKTMSFRGENCCDGKFSKERISVLVGANMTGTEKLPLLIIGKSKNPRCFRGVKELPTLYRNNTKAWMTSYLFEEFMANWDKELQGENRNVLAFVDNCTAHPKSVANLLKNIKLLFLPPNCTSVLQPMDMGIIKNIKHFYRNELVRNYIKTIEGDESIEINILQAMKILKQSWEKVSTRTISNCFSKAGWTNVFENENEFHDDEDDFNYESFTDFDNNVVSSGLLSDEDILQSVTEDAADDADKIGLNLLDNLVTNDCLETLEENLLTKENVSKEAIKLFYAMKEKLKPSL